MSPDQPRASNVIPWGRPHVALRHGTDPKQVDVETDDAQVDADGVHLQGADADGAEDLGRYVWVDLRVDAGEPMRALGEVQPRDPLTLALDIKFKHLWPDERRRLLRAIGK